MSSNRILFLDFDGVLQTPALESWQEMELCGGLQALLAELPDLDIVVSSSHREGRSLIDLRNLLPESIRQRVIDATPMTPRCRARSGRQAEIESWLAAHPEIECFAAVDDEAHLFADRCPWLVATHPFVGWNEDTTDSLRALLHPTKSRA